MTLIRRDTKAAIIGIFSQVFLHQELCVNFSSLNWPPTKVHNGEEIVRERALRLVHTKLKTNTSDLLNKEAQAQVITEVLLSRSYLKSFLQLIAEIKKVFASATVTGEEFPRLMAILNMTYLPKSTAGQVSYSGWYLDQLHPDILGSDGDGYDGDHHGWPWHDQGLWLCQVPIRHALIFKTSVIFFSAEAMDRLLQCATHALPYFSASVSLFYDHKDIEKDQKNIDRL